MKSCVYRHFDRDGNLLYVGLTSSIMDRTRGHGQKSAWMSEITKVTVEWFQTRREAVVAERAAIRDEKPAHNRIRYKDKPERKPRHPRPPDAGLARATKHDRLRRANFMRIDGWVTPDDYWRSVAKRLEREQAKADEIASTPGKRGRKPKCAAK